MYAQIMFLRIRLIECMRYYVLLAPHRASWCLLGLPGASWACLGLSGHISTYLDPSGSYLGISGPIGPVRAYLGLLGLAGLTWAYLAYLGLSGHICTGVLSHLRPSLTS